jgi:hypothetical protein
LIRGHKNVQIKGQILFKGEIITKLGWGYSKIFFSRNTKTEKLRFAQKPPKAK